MFKKPDIDGLLAELKNTWGDKPEYQDLLRHAHLAIAHIDSGRRLRDDIDTRVASLVAKHEPSH